MVHLQSNSLSCLKSTHLVYVIRSLTSEGSPIRLSLPPLWQWDCFLQNTAKSNTSKVLQLGSTSVLFPVCYEQEPDLRKREEEKDFPWICCKIAKFLSQKMHQYEYFNQGTGKGCVNGIFPPPNPYGGRNQDWKILKMPRSKSPGLWL